MGTFRAEACHIRTVLVVFAFAFGANGYGIIWGFIHFFLCSYLITTTQSIKPYNMRVIAVLFLT